MKYSPEHLRRRLFMALDGEEASDYDASSRWVAHASPWELTG